VFPDESILNTFNLASNVEKLPGGSTGVYRVANLVLKHVTETSLENNHSPDLAGWIAEFSAKVRQDGFRLPRGVPTKDGCWVTDSGWTAWTFVEGRLATAADIPDCIAAIDSLHRALRDIAKNPLLDDSHTPCAKAHRWCLGDRPDHVHAVVRELVDELYRLRGPVAGRHYQVIHGDLNAENILVAPPEPPAFIDLSPFWVLPNSHWPFSQIGLVRGPATSKRSTNLEMSRISTNGSSEPAFECF